MNTLTEPDRKLAETLKSLSLERRSEPPKPRRKAILWIPGVLIAAAVPAAVMLVSPTAGIGIKSALSGVAGPSSTDRTIPLHKATTGSENPPADARPPRPARQEITGSGYVIAPRSTAVFARYQGEIAGLAVDLGDHVQSGQTLVILKDPSATLVLEQAKAAKVSADLALAAREISLAQTAAAFHRAEALMRGNTTSRKDLEEAEAAWRSAANLVEQGRQDIVRADLSIRIAQEQVDALTVRAPFAGTVTKLNAHIGDTVLARADSVRESQSLLTLTDMSSMAIDADVAETNISLIRPGMRGEAVLDGFPDRPFRIELQRVAPVASVEKGTIGIRLSLLNPPADMKPNMAARIRIPVPEPQAQSHAHIGVAQP